MMTAVGDQFHRLTGREREIARFVAEGKTSSAIARDLGLSQRTVDNHLGSIFKKLGLNTRTQLALLVSSHRRR
jgi:DNA-binding CsgD family transcriptional regulator